MQSSLKTSCITSLFKFPEKSTKTRWTSEHKKNITDDWDANYSKLLNLMKWYNSMSDNKISFYSSFDVSRASFAIKFDLNTLNAHPAKKNEINSLLHSVTKCAFPDVQHEEWKLRELFIVNWKSKLVLNPTHETCQRPTMKSRKKAIRYWADGSV
jgi:hypothetical protein